MKPDPKWWNFAIHMQAYQKRKTCVREAWDVVQLEQHVHILLIMAMHKRRSRAPWKPLHKMVFKEKQQIKVEPTFVSGVSPQRSFWDSLAWTNFRRRHLTPTYKAISQLDMCGVLQILSHASSTTPCHDLLEFKFLSLRSKQQLEWSIQIVFVLGRKWVHGIGRKCFLPNPIGSYMAPLHIHDPFCIYHSLENFFSLSQTIPAL